MQKQDNYFVGVDIGTDSVGYAVTDTAYKPLRHGGEVMMGVHMLDSAQTAEERRKFRSARRRLDRRQQRIQLIRQLFATEIARVDPDFFRRLDCSALWEDDKLTPSKNSFFNDPDFDDRAYHKKYPTIHHLISELIHDNKPHDIRLVYLAVAYLTAHRGHFLNHVSKDKIEDVTDFDKVYDAFESIFEEKPWTCDRIALQAVLKKKQNITAKEKALVNCIFGGKKPKPSEDALFDVGALIKLLAGGTVKTEKLFLNAQYSEIPSVSLTMDEAAFSAIVAELDENGEILFQAKNLYDWSLLSDLVNGKPYLSDAKVEVYHQHKKDLAYLKWFIRKYLPEKYTEVFRAANKVGNYASYANHCKGDADLSKFKTASKQLFSEYLLKLVSKAESNISESDRMAYEDMTARLSACAFLPKQVDGDNRVIPYQLYYAELKKILQVAEQYLPFLKEKDETGLSVSDKILSVFTFRVPYYVGPLNPQSRYAWLTREREKLYPWNFDRLVDKDWSEESFIKKLIGTCTYLPGEKVVAKSSLLYCKFMVLDEINNLKIDGVGISVPLKQQIFEELYLQQPKVTLKKIKDFLLSVGAMRQNSVLSGTDNILKANLKSYHFFRPYLTAGTLTDSDVEWILDRKACSEDMYRFRLNLADKFPQLSEPECKKIASQNFRDFGRLSRVFLTEFYGANRTTGEAFTIMEALWNTNDNLMQLRSDRYTFREQIERMTTEFFSQNPKNLSERLDALYVSNSVKRPIIRTLDIIRDIVKVKGSAPTKIFIEMARDVSDPKNKKRTASRRDQILAFYKSIEDSDELRQLRSELEAKDDRALQGEKLYLYFIQLGKCMYTGIPISIDELSSNKYNVDHIYPQSYVKDDSLTNKVLVLSEINDAKKNIYPISKEIRDRMHSMWLSLKERSLISEEKFRRLTRTTPFSDDEKIGFINRQLVETRQSTKAVAILLQELYPETEIVYVKAGLVSEFRQEFGFWKCRSINDLHHAKDAYLNIVVGNVYHSIFSRQWFRPNRDYSVKAKAIYTKLQKVNDMLVWQGESDLALVRKEMSNDHIHLTKYAFCRHGGLFDQQPVKAGTNDSLIPRKKGMDPAKYGGYNKATASFFIPVRYTSGKKQEIMIIPVELMYAEQFEHDSAFAVDYAEQTVFAISGKKPEGLSFPLGMRKIKINTIFELDGCRFTLSGKSNYGKVLVICLHETLRLGAKWEEYAKHMDSFIEKRKNNPKLTIDAVYDKLSAEENLDLYRICCDKINAVPFCALISKGIFDKVSEGLELFITLDIETQVEVLSQIIAILKSGRKSGCNLKPIGGDADTAKFTLSSSLSNWKKRHQTAYIVDTTASGLHESKSQNLLELL